MPIGTIAGSVGSHAAGQNVNARDCDIPAGTANGDILVAYAGLTQDDTAATAITSPGWTAIGVFPRENPGGGDTGLSAVLIREWFTGDPVTHTFTKNGAFGPGSFEVVMIKVPGASVTPSVAPTRLTQTTVDLTVECPDVTVPDADSVVIRFYHHYWYDAAKTGTAVWTVPAPYVEQADGSGEWMSMGAATLLSGAGAANGFAASVPNSAGAAGRGVSLVLKSASTGPVTPTEQIDIQEVAVGAWASSAAGGASVTATIPTTSAFAIQDLQLLVVHNKTENVSGAVVTPTTPAGWSLLATYTNTTGGGTFGAGTGRTRITIFWRFANAATGGTVVVTHGAAAGRLIQAHVRCYRVVDPTRSNIVWSWPVAVGQQATASNTWSGALAKLSDGTAGFGIYAKDLLFLVVGNSAGVGHDTVPQLTQTGSTLTETANPATHSAVVTNNRLGSAAFTVAANPAAGNDAQGVNYTVDLAGTTTSTGILALIELYAFADVTGPEPGRMLMAAN